MNENNVLVAKAMKVATIAHKDGTRKGSETPYIVHPFEVAMILQDNGMNAQVIAAGLLHDVLEDTSVSPEELREEFGKYILDLVLGASEELEDRDNRPWQDRKEHTISFLRDKAPFAVKCIGCADKLSNARSMLRDIVNYEKEEDFWNRFSAGKERQKWYYESLIESLEELEGLKMYNEFKRVIERLFEG
ncbi:HD domain-containing protein [Natronospora cellulosivora (SeqCode)]